MMVYLVGAGPGDSSLITVKGKNALEVADVVIYDYLANPQLLKHTKTSCEKIYVGKKVGNHTLSQDEINELLVVKAKENEVVVRLKGGDPYVFGRGGEEALTLKNAGIDFEVVPGITSAIGGLCYAGIPITHRNVATSFHVITGHTKSGCDGLNFKAYAMLEGTLVFLMGVGNLKNIVNGLVSNNKDKETPVAIIYRASTPYQKTLVGTLETIVKRAEEENVKPPSLIVVGEVINKRDGLKFFENKPLFGKNIIVTRSRSQNSSLIEKIEKLGANPIEMPTIEIKERNLDSLKNEMEVLDAYDYTIFSSVNSVNIFFESLKEKKLDARAFAKGKIVSVGAVTTKELGKYGIIPDYQPKSYVAEDIVSCLKNEIKADDKILIPASMTSRKILKNELEKLCTVKEIKIYETVKVESDYSHVIEMLENNEIDYVTFTSSSTVENFMESINNRSELLEKTKVVSIGPITSKTIENKDIKVYKEASTYTINGMIDVIRGEKNV